MAETTDWLTGSQANAFSDELDKSHQVPTSLACKSGPGTGPLNGGALFKFTYRDNGKDLYWRWNWGVQALYKKSSATFTKQGFRRVSHDSFTRPDSKLYIQCAVWHKS
jgi:hypothetical protein